MKSYICQKIQGDAGAKVKREECPFGIIIGNGDGDDGLEDIESMKPYGS